MVTKVKDEENDSVHALVRSPPVAVPTPPSQVSSPFKNDIKISFMNTQLEPEQSPEKRMAQLDWCLANMELLDNDTTAILAGDMNIQEESELCFPSLGRELCSTRAKS